jgi:hypothetical protein
MDSEAELNLLVELLNTTVILSKAIEMDEAGNPDLVREVLHFAEFLNMLRRVAIVKKAAAQYPIKGVLLIGGKSIKEIV